jgi:hypothetical protein
LSARGALAVSSWRLLALAGGLIVAFLVLRSLLRTDEDRLSDAIDEAREALLSGRDDAFLAHFIPEVSYREGGGLAELRADLVRFRTSPIRRVEITERRIKVDGAEGDVRFSAELFAGIRPLGQVVVSIRTVKRDGQWRVARLSWD